jgi:integrase
MSYKLVRELDNGKLIRLTLGVNEVDDYLKFLRYRCRQNTWLSYAYDLQVFLNTINKPLKDILPVDILAFIESQRMVTRALSNRTIKRRLATVFGLYEYLRIFYDYSPKGNPVPRGITRRSTLLGHRFNSSSITPLIKAPDTLPRPLEDEEVNRFVASLRSHRDKAMVLIMLLAGLRKSEVLNLALKDIDFAQHTLFVRDGKGGHQRFVAISDIGLKELLIYLNSERPPSNSDRVFLVMKGPRIGQSLGIEGMRTIVDYHREKANTPGIQCHRLRHTCFTRLRQGGMSLEALQAQAGHRSIISTRIYLHLCPKELQNEYLKLSGTVFPLSKDNREVG